MNVLAEALIQMMVAKTRFESILHPPAGKVADKLPGTHVRNGASGFTLIEIMISIAILGILVAIATPFFISYRERARVAVAISEMKGMEAGIYKYASQNGEFPDTLGQIGYANLIDPWGSNYRYLRIEGAPKSVRGSARKDHFLVPVNSDFDLYSKGQDRSSAAPFTAKSSQDDIVRAFSGGYYGKVEDM
jgi:general secretion pathway protein G